MAESSSSSSGSLGAGASVGFVDRKPIDLAGFMKGNTPEGYKVGNKEVRYEEKQENYLPVEYGRDRVMVYGNHDRNAVRLDKRVIYSQTQAYRVAA